MTVQTVGTRRVDDPTNAGLVVELTRDIGPTVGKPNRPTLPAGTILAGQGIDAPNMREKNAQHRRTFRVWIDRPIFDGPPLELLDTEAQVVDIYHQPTEVPA